MRYTPEQFAALMPKAAEIETLVRDLERWGDLALDGKHQGLTPMLNVLYRGIERGADGDPICSAELKTCVHILDVDLNTSIEKSATLFQLGEKFYERQEVPLMVGMITECWVAHWPADKPPPYLLPEDDPNRKEALSVAVGRGAVPVAMSRRYVRRDRDNQVRPVGPWHRQDLASCTRAHVNILVPFWKGFFTHFDCDPFMRQEARS